MHVRPETALLFPGLCRLAMYQLEMEMPDLCALGSRWRARVSGKRPVVPVWSEVKNAVQIQVQLLKAQHRHG